MNLVLGAIIALFAIHFSWARARQERVAIGDIGNLFVIVLILYYLFPALFFGLTGFVPSETWDNRLITSTPSEAQVVEIYWIYAAFLFGVVLVYNGFGTSRLANVTPTIVSSPAQMTAVGLLYVVIGLILFILKRVYHLLDIVDHGDYYRNIARMPLILQQIYITLSAFLVLCKIGVVAVLIKTHQLVSRIALYTLIFEIAINTDFIGSRSDIITVVLIVIVSIDIAWRKINTLTAGVVGLVFIVCFLAFGYLRAQTDGGGASALDILTSSSEFTAVFATAFDVAQQSATALGAELRAVVLLDPLLSVIPQQISPITKISPADWYIRTFYPSDAEAGLGYAFGAVAESATGSGWPEAIVRGGIVGFILARCNRSLHASHVTLSSFIVNIYLAITAFNFFRLGTFYFVPLILLRVVPFLAAIWLIGHLLERLPRQDIRRVTA